MRKHWYINVCTCEMLQFTSSPDLHHRRMFQEDGGSGNFMLFSHWNFLLNPNLKKKKRGGEWNAAMYDNEDLERDGRLIALRPEMCHYLLYFSNDLEVIKDDIKK